MTIPKQSPPVRRPHLVKPADCVDVQSGRPQDLFALRIDLLHGANYNDPASFTHRSYQQVMHSGWRGFGNAGLF